MYFNSSPVSSKICKKFPFTPTHYSYLIVVQRVEIMTQAINISIMAAKIRQELSKRNWTQSYFARHVGITRAHLSDILHGRYKGQTAYGVVYAIARVLSMSTEELLDLPPLPPKNPAPPAPSVKPIEPAMLRRIPSR